MCNLFQTFGSEMIYKGRGWEGVRGHGQHSQVLISAVPAVQDTCADPEIFMRGGPTKMVIFGHRQGGSNP